MIYWAFLLLGLGLLVVALELFVPSAGILGLVAATLFITAIVLGFVDSLKSGALILLLTAIAVPALLAMMVKVWPHTPLGKRILLKDLTPEDVLPNKSHYQRTKDLEGRIGIAKTKMLPSGIVVVEGEKYDAVCEGFAIEVGDAVKVVDVRENRIYVLPYDGPVAGDSELPPRDGDILSRPLEDLGLDDFEEPLG